MSFSNAVELSDFSHSGEKSSSPWGGISQKNRSRGGGSGSMERSLLGGNSSSSSSPVAEREQLRSLVGRGKSKIEIHPCTICCTIFSTISALCLVMLGIYGGIDYEGKYLILVEGASVEDNRTSRGAQVGHIIGAAILYGILAAGCGFRWFKQRNGEDVTLNFRRQTFLNPSFE
tara:strand:+ start:44 stop:565 length:522 start_codon:yes stop_codon:yes gene_type:complete